MAVGKSLCPQCEYEHVVLALAHCWLLWANSDLSMIFEPAGYEPKCDADSSDCLQDATGSKAEFIAADSILRFIAY